MKQSIFAFFAMLIITSSGCDNDKSTQLDSNKTNSPNQEFYQLKVYTLKDDDQENTTETYLKDAFLPGLKRMGIRNIGVFKERSDGTDSTKQIFVLIPFESLSQFESTDEKLSADELYLAAGSVYLDAPYDKPPYQRIESTLLKAFSDMPILQIPELGGDRADRIYELRSYESATEKIHKNKVDMFNAGGEIKLFDRLGFKAVFYASAISGSKMPNLVYMTTFENQESRDEHWKAFVDAPEWKEMIAMPKYQNNVSHIDIFFLYPTDYSDY